MQSPVTSRDQGFAAAQSEISMSQAGSTSLPGKILLLA